eukprot:scaffold12630_cov118-Isochrysis_galbana.AAC.7
MRRAPVGPKLLTPAKTNHRPWMNTSYTQSHPFPAKPHAGLSGSPPPGGIPEAAWPISWLSGAAPPSSPERNYR